MSQIQSSVPRGHLPFILLIYETESWDTFFPWPFTTFQCHEADKEFQWRKRKLRALLSPVLWLCLSNGSQLASVVPSYCSCPHERSVFPRFFFFPFLFFFLFWPKVFEHLLMFEILTFGTLYNKNFAHIICLKWSLFNLISPIKEDFFWDPERACCNGGIKR